MSAKEVTSFIFQSPNSVQTIQTCLKASGRNSDQLHLVQLQGLVNILGFLTGVGGSKPTVATLKAVCAQLTNMIQWGQGSWH
mmetsp:Transcript_20335/g.36319  ORF Transcript_20335/g.36319 Transcript_20335/m.36319 type:complete len:82 (+) Transcript_20335:1340-1585(+)